MNTCVCEMEVEKLARVGESLGLSGTELHTFIKEQQDIARNERAAERDRIKEEKELAELKLNAERVKLEAQENFHANHTPGNAIRSPKLPAFVCGKDNLDVYLHRFERYAKAQSWPKHVWATNLSALLTGKALDTYSRLDDDDAQDYEQVKEAILKRYSLTSEGFRKRLRSARPESGETAAQFSIRLRSYLDK